MGKSPDLSRIDARQSNENREEWQMKVAEADTGESQKNQTNRASQKTNEHILDILTSNKIKIKNEDFKAQD